MNQEANPPAASESSLIRIGGLAIIVGMAIHIVLNVVLKEFPPEDPTSSELQEYLAREAGTWATIHGFRYLAFTCIVLFAAGLFARTCRTRSAGETGWGVVGLLGAAIFVTNGIITNGVEILAFHNFAPGYSESGPLLAPVPTHACLLYRGGRHVVDPDSRLQCGRVALGDAASMDFRARVPSSGCRDDRWCLHRFRSVRGRDRDPAGSGVHRRAALVSLCGCLLAGSRGLGLAGDTRYMRKV